MLEYNLRELVFANERHPESVRTAPQLRPGIADSIFGATTATPDMFFVCGAKVGKTSFQPPLKWAPKGPKWRSWDEDIQGYPRIYKGYQKDTWKGPGSVLGGSLEGPGSASEERQGGALSQSYIYKLPINRFRGR